MKLEEVLKQAVNCDCGKKHFVSIEEVVVDSPIVEYIAEYLQSKAFQRVLLAADENTYKALGQQVYEHLQDKIKVLETVIFRGPDLLPDETNVETLRQSLRATEYDTVLAVGSGVINDLVRYTTFEADLPYISVATAPSMDGYASNMAAMQFSGLKLTFPARPPIAVFADVAVLTQAPYALIQSGFGDLAGKVISLSDWTLASSLYGEYFCEKIFNLIWEPLAYVVETSESLANRNSDAVKNLFYGLIDSGIGMAMAGNSRPASGSEHHCSHYWDWCAYIGKRSHMSHGLQVGVATGWMARFYDRFFSMVSMAPSSVPEIGDEFQEYAKAFYGNGADNIIKAQRSKAEMLRKNADTISNIDDLSSIHTRFSPLRSLLESVQEALGIMGIPQDTREVEVDIDMLRETFLHAKELRPRYTIFDFFEGQGLLDSVVHEIVDETPYHRARF